MIGELAWIGLGLGDRDWDEPGSGGSGAGWVICAPPRGRTPQVGTVEGNGLTGRGAPGKHLDRPDRGARPPVPVLVDRGPDWPGEGGVLPKLGSDYAGDVAC